MKVDSISARINVIFAICRKDLIGLGPLIVLVNALIIAETLIAKADLGTQGQTWVVIQLLAPYIGSAAIGLLIIAAFQLDPPSSLIHDWLVRPIRKTDMFLAKVFFLALTIVVPLVLVRVSVNIVNGLSFAASLAEASVFKTPTAMVSIPLVIGIGIISRNVLQALGLVFGVLLIVIVVLVVPSLTAHHPDKFNLNGFQWLPFYLALTLMLGTLWFVSWFQYHKRDSTKARVSIGIGLLVSVFFVFATFQMPLWPPFYQALSNFVNDVDEGFIENITLDSVYSCYPAVTIGNDIYGNAETPQEGMKGLAGLNYFTAWELDSAGQKGIAFSTRVQARNLPTDWRLVTVNATATYSSADEEVILRLSPAAGATPARVNAGSDGAHFWAIPEQAIEKLTSTPSTQLSLDLSVAVLEPTSYVLEPDSELRYFPGAGYCSAEIDTVLNELNVECFKRGARPVIVSGEIEGIPATRVDAAMPDFTPNFMQLFGGQHYRMTISSPSLVPNPKALITVFNQKAFLSKQLVSEGVLGADITKCPLPGVTDESASLLSSWSDRSPHQVSFVNVDRNVRVEVLEWAHQGMHDGTKGPDAYRAPTLVLIAGGGSTAHSYDEIAPRLAQNFRVIAVTRRGFGASSKPMSGYDLPTLANDIIQVMDSMNVSKAILVGHSLGGDELSTIGADYPERVAGLVYLDAAYNRKEMDNNERGTRVSGFQPPTPRPLPEDLESYVAMQDYFDRLGLIGSPEGSIMSTFDFTRGASSTDRRIGEAIFAQLTGPRYEEISVPAVSIYAVEEIENVVRPWFDKEDALLRSNAERAFMLRSSFQDEQIKKFKEALPNAKVIELVGADHAVHISHEDEVVDAILQLQKSIE